jgi:hypothetical protein
MLHSISLVARANNPNDVGKIPQCTTKEVVICRHDIVN